MEPQHRRADLTGVLADRRRTPDVGPRHELSVERRAVEHHLPEHRLLDPDRELARDVVRVRSHVRTREHWCRGHAELLTAFADGVLGVGAAPFGDPVVEIGRTRETRRGVVERGIGRPRGLAHRGAQPAPVGVVTARDRDPLFVAGAPVETPRRALLAAVAERHHRPRVDALGGEQVGERAGDRFDLRDLRVRARVRAPHASDQRRQRDDGAQATGVVIRVDRRRARGVVAVCVVPEVEQPAGALAGGAVPAPVGPRAVRSHELTRHHHDVRVHRDEIGEAETQVVHRPGRVVLDHDVGVLGEPEEQVVALRGLGVRAEPELRAARRDERGRELAAGHGAHEVGVRARLDLDDLRAVLGEAPSDFHADCADAEVHDAHTRERRGRLRRRRRRSTRVAEVGEDLLGVLADVGWRRVRPGAHAIELEEAGEHGRGDAVPDTQWCECAP